MTRTNFFGNDFIVDEPAILLGGSFVVDLVEEVKKEERGGEDN